METWGGASGVAGLARPQTDFKASLSRVHGQESVGTGEIAVPLPGLQGLTRPPRRRSDPRLPLILWRLSAPRPDRAKYC
jgi:hypothetical protein